MSDAAETRGIEMFTFFGDGSRIGLPSLEVPVEAYPGIPLRSDRIRSRRRAARPPAPQQGQLPAGVTIRAMPAARQVAAPKTAPAGKRPASVRPTAAAPVPPLPEHVLPPRGEAD